jgi:hypothetical protein
VDHRRLPVTSLAGALAGPLAVALGRAGAAGPWRGQVVDAETTQPLEG